MHSATATATALPVPNSQHQNNLLAFLLSRAGQCYGPDTFLAAHHSPSPDAPRRPHTTHHYYTGLGNGYSVRAAGGGRGWGG